MKFSIKSITKLKMARISVVIIFLALIRTISEVFRLQYYSATQLTYEQIKPFIIGALVSSISLFAMTIFLFYSKHKTVIVISVLTIISLLIIKKVML